jgi:cytochrome c oxidase cbb3-type subunit 1
VYSFAEVVGAMHPYYVARAIGGLLYLSGAAVMAVNIWLTIAGKVRSERPMAAPAQLQPAE